MTEPRLFCFGLGFSALALARRKRAAGWRVAGTTRSAEKAERLAAEGVEAFLFDAGRPLDEPDRALAGATHLLASAPPGEAGDPVLAAHADAVARLPGLQWIGYLSTTGVYGDRAGGWVDEGSALEPGGDRAGGWVDEGSALEPSGERGRRRLEAERAWLDLGRRSGAAVQLFRLAGIYGPGRSQLDSVASGRARRIVKPGQVFSRIHVEDIASVLEASMARPDAGAAYNVCDDEPADPAEVVAFAAGLLGLPVPPAVPFEEAELGAMARSFYADSKRVSNRRIKEELGVRLRYPDYRSGLRALLAEREG